MNQTFAMKQTYKFWVLRSARSNTWHWHLEAPNGRITSDNRGFNSRGGARAAVNRLKRLRMSDVPIVFGTSKIGRKVRAKGKL